MWSGKFDCYTMLLILFCFLLIDDSTMEVLPGWDFPGSDWEQSTGLVLSTSTGALSILFILKLM